MSTVATPENLEDVELPHCREAAPCLIRLAPLGTSPLLFPIDDQEILIGRLSHCDLELAGDEAAAREHAVLGRVGEECWIRDCSGPFGTFVNDRPIAIETLAPGDRIRMGSHLFRFLSTDGFDTQYREAIYFLATTDPVSGAHNRCYFEEAFERELLRAQRHWRPIALLLLKVEEQHRSHRRWQEPSGDECLRSFSKLVRSRIRAEDLFARLSDQTFALALTEAPLKQSVRVAQDLRRLIESQSFMTGQGPVDVNLTIGVGFANGQGPITSGEILKQAHDNLLRALSDGRNCVRY